jgi:hypothetical protein
MQPRNAKPTNWPRCMALNERTTNMNTKKTIKMRMDREDFEHMQYGEKLPSFATKSHKIYPSLAKPK